MRDVRRRAYAYGARHEQQPQRMAQPDADGTLGRAGPGVPRVRQRCVMYIMYMYDGNANCQRIDADAHGAKRMYTYNMHKLLCFIFFHDDACMHHQSQYAERERRISCSFRILYMYMCKVQVMLSSVILRYART